MRSLVAWQSLKLSRSASNTGVQLHQHTKLLLLLTYSYITNYLEVHVRKK